MALSLAIYKHKYLIKALSQDGLGVRQRLLHWQRLSWFGSSSKTQRSPHALAVTMVNTWFKKDLKLQIHLNKIFFSDNQFLDSLHQSFLNHSWFEKGKIVFLNSRFTEQTRDFSLLVEWFLAGEWLVFKSRF
jgi:hypothetical protein